MAYRTLAAAARRETVVRASRFVAYAAPAADAEEAGRWLAGLRAEHPFATHVCYAYVVGESGEIVRCADDGEPGGTAGAPILEALRRRGLVYAAAAVVRYFGGVKLGAGGLTRAYAAAAAAALGAAGTVTMARAELLRAEFDYPAAARLKSADEIGREYGDRVRITFAALDGAEALAARLAAALGAPVRLERIGETRRPVAES